MERTAILIPAFNAAVTLPTLIRRIENHVKRSDILIVDDGSQDRTSEVACENRVQVLCHERNYGKGRALRTGFDYIVTSTDYQAVVTMDADMQHRPEELPSFFAVRELQHVDLVIGSRVRWGTTMPFPRKLSNTITSALVSARTGLSIKDSQCGYRLISRKVLESVATTSDGYEAETELLIKAAMKDFRIEFVPIQTIYSDEKTYMTNFHTTVRFLNVLLKEY